LEEWESGALLRYKHFVPTALSDWEPGHLVDVVVSARGAAEGSQGKDIGHRHVRKFSRALEVRQDFRIMTSILLLSTTQKASSKLPSLLLSR